MGNLTTLTTKGAENLEKSLESLQEKDLTIRKLQDAITRERFCKSFFSSEP